MGIDRRGWRLTRDHKPSHLNRPCRCAYSLYVRNMGICFAYTKKLMEYGSGVVAINPQHTKLITAHRTAVEKGEGYLDKEATSHDDCLDAFRLSLQFWH